MKVKGISMQLTPADVHNVAFSKPPIGKRGYNEDEVDQFLDLVEDTLSELLDENSELKSAVESNSTESRDAASSSAASAPSAGSSVDEGKASRNSPRRLRRRSPVPTARPARPRQRLTCRQLAS